MTKKDKDVATKEETLPAEWQEKLAEHAVAAAKDERPSAGYISLRAGILSINQTPVPDNKLNVIIMEAAFENTYYVGAFNPDRLQNPECFAINLVESEMAPHEMASDPQNEVCEGCAQGEWGSKEGSRGKACQQRRRLICIPADVEDPDDILTSEVAVLKVPVTSVRNWGTYVNTLSTIHKRPPFAMITELSTVPDPKTQFKLLFKPVAALNHEFLTTIMQKRDMSRNVLLKPYEKQEQEEPKEDTKYAG